MIQLPEFPAIQSEVATAVATAKAKINALEAQIKIYRGFIEGCRSVCAHPEKYTKYHYDGSSSENCPDCGWSVG